MGAVALLIASSGVGRGEPLVIDAPGEYGPKSQMILLPGENLPQMSTKMICSGYEGLFQANASMQLSDHRGGQWRGKGRNTLMLFKEVWRSDI